MTSTKVSFTEGFNNPMGQGFSNFGQAGMVSGSKEFLMSNTLIAKLGFLLLVIIVFFILLRLIIQTIVWWNKDSKNPWIIACRRDGDLQKSISSNPKIKDSIPILRSENERNGLEFTWSLWLYIKKPHTSKENSQDPTYYHIFHKGNVSGNGYLSAKTHNVAPGLYIEAKTTNDMPVNNLVAVINTFKGDDGGSEQNLEKSTVIKSIPFGKWLHIAMVVKQKNFDVYVNGQLASRRILKSLPMQNYGGTHISQRGYNTEQYGFNGEISSLRYFNSALNPVEITSIAKSGPNMCSDSSKPGPPPYFSNRWYTGTQHN
jgi:hypothetical protein